MSSREWTRDSAAGGPALGESRAQVLAVLQDAGAPLAVQEVAERVRLHPNTTRFHLDGLVEAGLVERASEDRAQPGRPRMLYRAVPGGERVGQRSYRLLSEILASYLAAQSPRPAQAATAAGEAWGRFLAERPAPYQKVDDREATARLVATLDDIGFAPEAVTAGRQRQILLHHCPFRETAEQHREVVCSVHLGLMRGLLAELDAPLEADQLEPFVEPSLCVAHLGRRAKNPAPRRRRSG